jgi:hypothetical protein
MKLKFKSLQGSTFSVDAEPSDSVSERDQKVDISAAFNPRLAL